MSVTSLSASLAVSSAQEAGRRLNRTAAVVFVAIFTLVAGTLLGSSFLHVPVVFALIVPALLFSAWVIHSPAVGVYTLFAAALMIAIQPLTFATSITDLPFFVNLPFAITPAEILIVITSTGLIAQVAARQATAPGGRLMLPYLAFGVAVLFGEANGLVHGGDFKLSLWELRPQVYGLILFGVTSMILQDRSQLKILLAILLIAEAFKGADGVYRFFLVLDPQIASMLETNQAHEDSFLLGLFVVAVAIGLIWLRRPVLVLLVALVPIVLTAIIVNHRRAGELGLGLELAVVIVVAYIVEPRLRHGLIVATIVMAALAAAFLVVFWNHDNGTIGEMVRPFKSLFDPSIRDQSSDTYRIAENHNLIATFRSSPIFGIGFGHPYYVYWPQVGASKFDPLWNIVPHNNLLWIPMRMGLLGLITFWGLISMAIAEGVWTIRIVRDKFVRAVVLFALVAVVGELFTGYVDVGLESYRNLIVLGVMLAVINRATYLAGVEQPADRAASVLKAGSDSARGDSPVSLRGSRS